MLNITFWCRHKACSPVGETYTKGSIIGGDVELWWCPKCGAIGHKLWHQNVVWTKPGWLACIKRLGEIEESDLMV